MSSLVGRKAEKQLLDRLLSSDQAELLAIYGRRRVGKTFLISRYLKNKGLYFEITGAKNSTTQKHIKRFIQQIKTVFKDAIIDSHPKDWFEAFSILEHAIKNHKSPQKIILFFDEFPWIDLRKSGLIPAFEVCWNTFLSRDARIITVLCGSSVSWMIKKVIRNKGGLYGRLTAQIRLKPFTLKETEEFFQVKHIHLNRKQITELYMATGGIPKYLGYVERGNSSAQIIQNLCFNPISPLTTEFEALYESLFDNYQLHMKIIEILANNRYGLTYSQVLQLARKHSGGSLSRALKELIASDFVRFIPFLGNRKKEGKYRLVDEYSLFYLTWIKHAIYNYDEPISDDYWTKQQMSNRYKIWAGYTFENICFKHIRQIVDALKLTVVADRAAHWSYVPKDASLKGAQIDLIIDRADQCMNLCELKFYNKEYVMTEQDYNKLHNRREIFREQSKGRKTLFNTLITPYGAPKNMHYLGAVDNQLTIDDLFT